MILINKIKQVWYRVALSPEEYAKKMGVKFGKKCKISTYKIGSEPYLITLGNHVHITANVQFINHDGGVWIFRDEIPDFDVFGKIFIDDNTFIGNNAVIMPGVKIGKNCVVGANSLVTKSFPDNCIIAGIPAKFIMHTHEYKEKMVAKNAKTKSYFKDEKKNKILNLPDELFMEKPYYNIK